MANSLSTQGAQRNWDMTDAMAALQRRCQEAAARTDVTIAQDQTKAPTVSGETIDRVAAPANASAEVRQTPPPLEWLKPTDARDMAVKTKCGRYSCSKVILDGRTTYELWHMVPSGNWFTCVKNGLESFAKAKEIAQAHSEGRR